VDYDKSMTQTREEPATTPDAPPGLVFDIQRFSLHDGPGIRTTVFLKGCPLSCPWCHNPESQDFGPEISFVPAKCIGCGRCAQICPRQSHRVENGRHVFDRQSCIRCGACAAHCPSGALERVGRLIAVSEVMCEVLRDKPFYANSGGGLTLSGGEPMAQFPFARALLATAKAQGLHTCIETSGACSTEELARVVPLVDLFLFDCKDTDPVRHHKLTGAPLDAVLASLRCLDDNRAAVMLRCPLVPGANADQAHLDGIARLANAHPCVREIHLLPYHPLGTGKAERVGRPAAPAFPTPSREDLARWASRVAGQTPLPVRADASF